MIKTYYCIYKESESLFLSIFKDKLKNKLIYGFVTNVDCWFRMYIFELEGDYLKCKAPLELEMDKFGIKYSKSPYLHKEDLFKELWEYDCFIIDNESVELFKSVFKKQKNIKWEIKIVPEYNDCIKVFTFFIKDNATIDKYEEIESQMKKLGIKYSKSKFLKKNEKGYFFSWMF